MFLNALLLFVVSCLAFQNSKNIKEFDAGCSNEDNTVSCCFDEDLLGFIDINGCAELTFDFETLDVTIDLVLNSKVLFETTFGLDTQPELCVDNVFGLEKICIGLTDLKLDDFVLSGCLSLIFNDKKDVEIGCFELGK